MTRLQALLLAALLWAGLFLPGLGSIEIKGEEGRRILPAVTMLETGNWIVPYVGGRPYLRKPPLINWLVAASFQLTGQRNEWAARLPSALSVLALAAVIIAAGSAWLTPGGALLTAIVAMTNLGMLEKGRLAEIEAGYVALTGIALVLWLAAWRADRSRWLVWLPAGVALGLGLLLKGPLHLLFFYAVVVAVLWKARRLRELASVPHCVAVVVMLAMFAAWAVPYLHAVRQLNATGVWTAEFAGRVTHSKITFRLWIENVWNNFENFLPWLLFVPLWWSRRVLDALTERDRALFLGTRLAVTVLGCGLCLIPGVLSRYMLPLVVPSSLLVGVALGVPGALPVRAESFWRNAVKLLLAFYLPFVAWITVVGLRERPHGALVIASMLVAAAFNALWKRERIRGAVHLAVGTALVACLGTQFFVAAIPQQISKKDTARPLARQINAALPATARELHVIDPDYQPALFYVRPKCLYARRATDVPPTAEFVLLRPDAIRQLTKTGRTGEVLARFPDRGGRDFIVLRINGI